MQGNELSSIWRSTLLPGVVQSRNAAAPNIEETCPLLRVESALSRAGSGNVRRIDIILVLLWLMTFKALFGWIADQRFCLITSRPGLETPASRRGILLLVLQHDGGRLPWTFHVGAIGDGEFVQIDQ